MNRITRAWRNIWRQEVTVGDPHDADTWQSHSANEFVELYPPFNLGLFMWTLNGGWRLLFIRWLTLIDVTKNEPHYLPLMWVEWIPTEPKCEQQLRISLVVPSSGQFSIGIAGSMPALIEHGPIRLFWDSWSYDETE